MSRYRVTVREIAPGQYAGARDPVYCGRVVRDGTCTTLPAEIEQYEDAIVKAGYWTRTEMALAGAFAGKRIIWIVMVRDERTRQC